MRYPVELWQIIDKRLYFHPVNHPVIRTYGYVKNIVHQVYQILLADEELVNKKTFYLGDYSIDSYSWLNEFSFNLNGNKIKRLPTFVFKYLAKIGDFLRKFSVPFPLYSKRFRNMVENYPAPTEPTIKLFGLAEVSLKKNILETIAWLKSDGKHLFNYWNNK
jgi:hypothetical protein